MITAHASRPPEPAPSPSSSPTSRARRGCCTSSAQRRYAEALAEHRRVVREACARRGRRRGRHAGRRVLLRLPYRAGRTRGGVRDHRRRSRQARSGCGSGCTRGRRSSPRKATSAPTSTVPPASPRPGTAGRCSCRPRPPRSSSRRPTDLGEHRFKDLVAPRARLPARQQRVPAAQDALPHEPPRPGDAVPRARGELAEVVALCSPRDARLLTLTGPGGTGKTRLALQARPRPRIVSRTASAGCRSRRFAIRRSCSPRSRRCSAPRSGLAEHIGPTSGCLLCSTTSSRCVEAAAADSPTLRACPASTSSSRAGSACESAASRPTRCRRSPSRRRGALLAARPRSRSRVRGEATPSRALRSASTGCRSPSSSPPPAPPSSAPSSSSSGCPSGSTC